MIGRCCDSFREFLGEFWESELATFVSGIVIWADRKRVLLFKTGIDIESLIWGAKNL